MPTLHPAQKAGGVAVVTGAAVGMGRAVAARLAQERMELVLFDRDATALDACASDLLRASSHLQLRQAVGDLASESDIEKLRDEAFDFGHVTLLINNAAILKGAGLTNNCERRMQWAADDLIKNRPVLSRWHPRHREAFARYAATGEPT